MPSTESKEYFILVAAGSGSRFGADVPKQFCLLDKQPVLMHTIENCRRICPTASIILVLNEAMIDFWLELCKQYRFDSPKIVAGGAARFDSVKAALDTITDADNTIVYIHDGARPLITADVVDRLRNAIVKTHATAVIPVIPVSDSLRIKNDDGSTQRVDRSQFVSVQTPQAFRLKTIKTAYRTDYLPIYTDDASVVENVCSEPIHTVAGDARTIKITNRPDLAMVEAML